MNKRRAIVIVAFVVALAGVAALVLLLRADDPRPVAHGDAAATPGPAEAPRKTSGSMKRRPGEQQVAPPPWRPPSNEPPEFIKLLSPPPRKVDESPEAKAASDRISKREDAVNKLDLELRRGTVARVRGRPVGDEELAAVRREFEAFQEVYINSMVEWRDDLLTPAGMADRVDAEWTRTETRVRELLGLTDAQLQAVLDEPREPLQTRPQPTEAPPPPGEAPPAPSPR